MKLLERLLPKAWRTPAAQAPVPSARPSRRTGARASSNSSPTIFGGGGYGAYFEALRQSADRSPLTPFGVMAGVRTHVSGIERTMLSSLARAVYDNGGLPSLAVNLLSLYSGPIRPQANTGDDSVNDVYEVYFAEWAKRADFYNRPEMDFWALQSSICQSVDLDGDVGALMTAEAGFPQLQIIPGWRIGSGFEPNDTKAIDGVALDAKGRVTGYMIQGEDSEPVTVPAGQMMLVRDPSPSSVYRGISPLRRGLNDIRDSKDIQAFEKLAVKHNAALLGVIEGAPLDDDHGFNLSPMGPSGDGEEVGDGAPPEDATPGEEKLSRNDMLGGDIPILPEGREFKRVESNRPNAGYIDFLDSLAASFIAGLDLPPAFVLDTKLTGPSVRGVIGKAQRKFDQRGDVLCRLVEFVWVRVIAWGIEFDGLPAPQGWHRLTFNRPAKATIDAGREAAQDREDQASGLMTRSEHYGSRGRDWQTEIDQIFREEEYVIGRASEISKATGIPVETVLTRFGYSAKAPPPRPEGKDGSSEKPDGKAKLKKEEKA
jgi:hypothetical protein